MKLPARKSDTHKGQNGKVLVIGGNEVFHGAPILAVLGAEKSGVDLVFLMLPKQHATVAKNACLNCIIHTFSEDHFTEQDIANVDCSVYEPDIVVAGNGLGKTVETKRAILQLLENTKTPVVLDADALIPEIFTVKTKSEWIVTPHDGEFERLFGTEGAPENVRKMAKKHHITILKKGAIDLIADPNGNLTENHTGVPQMTVGGTGDALAGIIAGFRAQGLSAFEASQNAAFLWGKCGEELAKKRFSFSAYDMLQRFPEIVMKHGA